MARRRVRVGAASSAGAADSASAAAGSSAASSSTGAGAAASAGRVARRRLRAGAALSSAGAACSAGAADVELELREGIEATTGQELVDEDYYDVTDVVLLWFRDEDGDLTDAL
ncbi:DUF3052 family protein, partial [Streptomyces albidoflavus]|uniref:DUF3052 family protein n=1 Tax=Streptomyces albidoflavus TaxID=1886 RepID=UPI001F14730A